MKNLSLIVLLFFSGLRAAEAQTDLKLLKTPTSPAFIILDQTPNSIDRPSSLKALSASLQNAYDNGKIKPGFGLEITPFWMFKKINYSVKDYLLVEGRRKDHSYGRLLLHHLSFSMATSSTDTFKLGNIEPGLGLSYGARLLLIPGKITTTTKDKIGQLNDVENQLNDVRQLSKLQSDFEGILGNIKDDGLIGKAKIADRVKAVLKNNSALKGILDKMEAKTKDSPNYFDNKDSAVVYFDAIAKNLIGILNQSAVKLSNTIATAREGFMWEVAVAGLNIFENSKLDKGHFAKAAFWTTLSYRINADNTNASQSIDGLLTFRYVVNNSKVDSSNYFDWGLKLQVNRKRWSLAAEAVMRYATKPANTDMLTGDKPKNYTYRIAGSFDYQINDFLGFNVSFGKSFDGVSTTFDQKNEKSIFAVGGLNVGINPIKKGTKE